jgi:hypothetical protein
MNTFFKPIASDKILLLACIGTISLVFLTAGIIALLYKNLPPFIPLFNQMPWGVARLGTKDQLFIPVFMAFITLVINTTLASSIYEKNPLLARILCITCLLISFFIFLFTIRAVQIVL